MIQGRSRRIILNVMKYYYYRFSQPRSATATHSLTTCSFYPLTHLTKAHSTEKNMREMDPEGSRSSDKLGGIDNETRKNWYFRRMNMKHDAKNGR
jgi:hypothetical protein